MITTCAHTHTDLVDGHNSAEEMVRSAIERGFTAVGFSEHASQPFDARYGLDPAREEEYRALILALRVKYAPRIRIALGLERDAISMADRREYDYIIGASHYLTDEDGRYQAVDAGADALIKWIGTHYAGDGMEMARDYYARFSAYVRAYKPDIIAHFDLLMKNNRQKRLFDFDDPAYFRFACQAMEEMIAGCDVMEINTGGIARSGQPVPYPELRLLARWREMGGRVIVTSDCHYAHQIDAWYENAAQYAARAGYTHVLELSSGGDLFETRKLTF